MLSVYGWAGRAESILLNWYCFAAVGHSELVTGPSRSCELKRLALRRPNWMWLNLQIADNKTTKASKLSVKTTSFWITSTSLTNEWRSHANMPWSFWHHVAWQKTSCYTMLSSFFALTICGNPRFVYSLYVEAISLSPCGAHLKNREAGAISSLPVALRLFGKKRSFWGSREVVCRWSLKGLEDRSQSFTLRDSVERKT